MIVWIVKMDCYDWLLFLYVLRLEIGLGWRENFEYWIISWCLFRIFDCEWVEEKIIECLRSYYYRIIFLNVIIGLFICCCCLRYYCLVVF